MQSRTGCASRAGTSEIGREAGWHRKGKGGEKQSIMEDAVAIRIGRNDFKKG
jgi:hypothetical protein